MSKPIQNIHGEKSLTPKSVPFTHVIATGETFKMEKGSIIKIAGVKHIVKSIRKIEFGATLIRAYGKAEVVR